MPIDIRGISTYPPSECGVGKYKFNLVTALGKRRDVGTIRITALCGDGDYSEGYGFPVDLTADQYRIDSVKEAAAIALSKNPDVIINQHEFGIGENREGKEDNFVIMSRMAKKRGFLVISYLHTVPSDPDPYQLQTLRDLSRFSDTLVVHTDSAIKKLMEKPYEIDISEHPEKIEHIHHGVRPYNPTDLDRLNIKREMGLQNIMLITSLGLRGPNKGHEYSIRAYAELLKKCTPRQRKRMVYLIAGQCHPKFMKAEGGSLYRKYESGLKETISDCKLSTPDDYIRSFEGVDWEKHDVVVFDNFLDDFTLMKLYAASNVILMLYPNLDQISSGVLADAIGTGRAVITTKFEYARELLYPESELVKKEGIVGINDPLARGIQVDPGDLSVEQCAFALEHLIFEEKGGRKARFALEKRAQRYGYRMRWDESAHQLMEQIVCLKGIKKVKRGRGPVFHKRS